MSNGSVFSCAAAAYTILTSVPFHFLLVCLSNADINECSSQPCANGGTCVDAVNGFSCVCVAGYSGTRWYALLSAAALERFDPECVFRALLSQTDINECSSNPCVAGRGTCVDAVNGFVCTCNAGYSGTQCQTDINECSSSPCVAGQSVSCTDQLNGYLCTCLPGYSGLRWCVPFYFLCPLLYGHNSSLTVDRRPVLQSNEHQ
jgi:hypothetical protein